MAETPRSVVLPHVGVSLQAVGRGSFVRQSFATRERLQQPCYDLCLACGHMDPQEGTQLEACSRCGSEDRADLRAESVLEQLKTIDETLVHQPGPIGRLVGRVTMAAAMVALGGLATAGAAAFVYVFVRALFDGLLLFKAVAGFAFLGAFSVLVGLYGFIGFAYPAFTRLGGARRTRPVRWHESDEAAERSPLTGRTCTAYEIGIRSDDDPDAAPGTWVLRERRGPIDEPLVRVDVDPFSDGPARFLRERGIDPLGQDLVFFEAITTPRGPRVEADVRGR